MKGFQLKIYLVHKGRREILLIIYVFILVILYKSYNIKGEKFINISW